METEHAVFGDPAELSEPTHDELADAALGYPSAEPAPTDEQEEAPAEDDPSESTDEQPQTDEQPPEAAAPADWAQKEAQYEQAIRGLLQAGQMMQARMQQAGLLPSQPGAQLFPMGGFPYQSPQNTPQAPYGAQTGLPPTVQQTFGYPAGQAPAFGQQPHVPQIQPTAAQPAAPPAAPEVSDEALKEQYWEDPVKATRTLLEQQAARHRTEMEQREAYFGQVLGQQFLGPLMQQVQTQAAEQQFRDRVSQDYSALREQHEDFDAVVPVMRQIIKEQPQLIAQMRIDPQKHGLAALYALAKAKAGVGAGTGTAQPSLQSVPGGGKGAARMPRAGAARMQKTEDNDSLVEAALGPIASGGVFG